MTHLKKTLTKYSKWLCVFTLFFCMCTETSDNCGKGQKLDSNNQFCFADEAYDKCGGDVYDPSTQFCNDRKVYTRCSGNTYNPAEKFCSGAVIYDLCGGNRYNPADEGCVYGVLKTKCGRNFYDSDIEFCFTPAGSNASQIYELCSGQKFNPADGCGGASVQPKCGNFFYNPDISFCFNDKTYNLCGDKEYDPTTHSCNNGSIVEGAAIFTVSFNTNGGTPATIASVTVDGGTAIGAARFPANPSKADHSFDGWFNGTEQYIASTLITKNVELTAKWTENSIVTPPGTHRVTYDGSGSNGGEVPAGNIYLIGATVTVSDAGTLTKTGYTFDGWNTAADGTGTPRAAGATFAISANVTLYAQWKINEYTVELDALAGNAVSPASVTVQHGQTLAQLSLPTPTRKYYTFKGWSSDAIGGTQYANTYAVTDNIKLYARWTIQPSVPHITDDRDGQTYRTVTISNQTWMAENLSYDHNEEGCYFRTTPENCVKYGFVYTRPVAMDESDPSAANPSGVRGICPQSWHLPSNAEWNELLDAVGGNLGAGTKLKSTYGWDDDGNGTDEFEFSALPGSGYFRPGIPAALDNGIGSSASWWTTTNGTDMVLEYHYASISYDSDNFSITRVGANSGGIRSVRCVKD